MQKSFAQILNSMIAPEAAPRAAKRAIAKSFDDKFWSIDFARAQAPKLRLNQSYRVAPSQAKPEQNSTQPSVTERFWDQSTLTGEAARALSTLVRLGATELQGGFTARSLRRAHRRLAKQLHPDLAPGKISSFRALRSAYLILNKFSLWDGSEFASAPGCQRPDAA